MKLHQKMSIAALTLSSILSASVWAQAASSPAPAAQQGDAKAADAKDKNKDKKAERKTERRDERAEKRAMTERQHAHRRHHPKTVTP